MATWTDVINYVRLRYEVLEENESWIRFRVDTGSDRTHQVAVHHVLDPDGQDWIEISSPVGRADAVDLQRLLELAGTSFAGGAAIVDGVALLKHSAPLEELSIRHGFHRPFALVVARADELEEELTKTDEF